MKRLATTLSLLCLLALPALTQEFRSTISGHVTDASGAAVPNAKIQAVNVDNNETTTGNSDSSGAYTITFLWPGIYKVTATAAGFKQYVQDKLTLEAAKVSGIDIHLEVGGVNESVEVTADAVALDTQSATRSAIITTQQVAEMPLNARNPYMLGAMMAGVTFNGAAIWQRPSDHGAIPHWPFPIRKRQCVPAISPRWWIPAARRSRFTIRLPPPTTPPGTSSPIAQPSPGTSFPRTGSIRLRPHSPATCRCRTGQRPPGPGTRTATCRFRTTSTRTSCRSST